MIPLLTAVFSFLSTPAGQGISSAAGAGLAAAIEGLIGLAHKSLTATMAPAEASK
jgi:hypothetical protein